MRTSFRHQSEAQPPNGPLTAAASPDTPSHMPRHAVEITAQITRIRSRAARIDIQPTLLQKVAPGNPRPSALTPWCIAIADLPGAVRTISRTLIITFLDTVPLGGSFRWQVALSDPAIASPVRHLIPEAVLGRVVQLAPRVSLDPNRCARRRRDRPHRSPSPLHVAVPPSFRSVLPPADRRASRDHG